MTQVDRFAPRAGVVEMLADWWTSWRKRRASLAEFDGLNQTELARVAEDLGTSIPELLRLVGRGAHAADLLGRRLQSLDLDKAGIDLAVMRDLQRCCSQCGSKPLCTHELEDRPTAAAWPQYCPNQQTIAALLAEKER